MITNATNPDAPLNPAERRELLISRMVDGQATAADWAVLSQFAAADAGIFGEIAESQKINRLLREAACEALGPVARVEITSLPAVAGTIMPGSAPTSARRLRRSAFLGWGIAACLALALGSQMLGTRGVPIGPGNTAGLVPATYASPDDALNSYLELGKLTGKVVGEMPNRYVIKSQPLPASADGSDPGTEVLYVRQLIERAVVKDLYRLGTDELGRTILVPAPGAPSPVPASSPF